MRYVQTKYQYWRLFKRNLLVCCFKQKNKFVKEHFVLKQTHTINWTGNERINLYSPITVDNYSLCPSRFKVDIQVSRFLQRVRIARNAERCIIARGILSVCPSVCPSVTFRYCVQTNEDTIVRFSATGRTIPLVSGEANFIRIFAGDHPQRRDLKTSFLALLAYFSALGA